MAWRAARHIHSRVAETQKLLAMVHHLGRQCLEKLSGGSPPETPGPLRLAPERWLAYWQGTADHPPAIRQPLSVEAAFRARLLRPTGPRCPRRRTALPIKCRR